MSQNILKIERTPKGINLFIFVFSETFLYFDYNMRNISHCKIVAVKETVQQKGQK